MKVYKLSDSVLSRVVQILQESIILGHDISDLLRQIELVESDYASEGKVELILTQSYIDLVEKNFQELMKRAEELKSHTEADKENDDDEKPMFWSTFND